MWILLDNHDSFTHILHHYLQMEERDTIVVRNDEVSVEGLAAMQPERLIISPGPETPPGAGITMSAVAHFAHKIPVLGVCLGHQALGLHFGAKLVRGPQPVHGHTSRLLHTGHPFFSLSEEEKPEVMRYHSLVLENLENTGLAAIAHAEDDDTIQAIAHQSLPCIGVQFHPESIGTRSGAAMIKAWAQMYR